jgi:hypothetical protein
MHRFTTLLLSALAAATALTAAPAPFPRPATSKMWTVGWEKPVDPLGDCRFEREGGQLTITVPGKRHVLAFLTKFELTAPHLLREVEGDFVMDVRVRGNFQHSGDGSG